MTDADSPLLIALSGPTSSGKTTIATALASIFPSSQVSVLHADDFYKSDSAIPLHPSGVQDWDCADALNLPHFRRVLLDIKSGEDVPEKLVKQGGAEDGVHGSTSGLSQTSIESARETVAAWPPKLKKRKLVIVEGFLLFGEGVKDTLGSLFDLRILLRTTRETAQKRRKSRNGYVTLEGFWQDPEGYFEDVVWPNYYKDHGFLFEEGDVESSVKGEVMAGWTGKIRVGLIDDIGLEALLEWVLDCLRDALA